MPLRLAAAMHAFLSVLILGTMWRVIAYHLLAASNVHAQHIGAAMITQY